MKEEFKDLVKLLSAAILALSVLAVAMMAFGLYLMLMLISL